MFQAKAIEVLLDVLVETVENAQVRGGKRLEEQTHKAVNWLVADQG